MLGRHPRRQPGVGGKPALPHDPPRPPRTAAAAAPVRSPRKTSASPRTPPSCRHAGRRPSTRAPRKRTPAPPPAPRRRTGTDRSGQTAQTPPTRPKTGRRRLPTLLAWHPPEACLSWRRLCVGRRVGGGLWFFFGVSQGQGWAWQPNKSLSFASSRRRLGAKRAIGTRPGPMHLNASSRIAVARRAVPADPSCLLSDQRASGQVHGSRPGPARALSRPRGAGMTLVEWHATRQVRREIGGATTERTRLLPRQAEPRAH